MTDSKTETEIMDLKFKPALKGKSDQLSKLPGGKEII
jgi:hypothetical protein